MKVSARNTLAGTVASIKPGAINAEVVIALPGGAKITSVITIDALTDLKLEVGSKAFAIVKASNVIIGVE
jgi:molybdate transport system regulatory protein